MTDNANFGLVKSFHIDRGELDGFSPQECFVLGYELAEIDAAGKAGEPCQRPVHSANRERIVDACKDLAAKWTLDWMPNDVSESWLLFTIWPETPA